jgi:hypothetical protein
MIYISERIYWIVCLRLESLVLVFTSISFLRMEEQAKFGKLGILKKVGWILKKFHQ